MKNAIKKEDFALAPDCKSKDAFHAAIINLSKAELDEVFAYMVKRGYIKLERE